MIHIYYEVKTSENLNELVLFRTEQLVQHNILREEFLKFQ